MRTTKNLLQQKLFHSLPDSSESPARRAMRGLRAYGATWLALLVLVACASPCGVAASSGFDATALGRARARDQHQHRQRNNNNAPTPTGLHPSLVSIHGGAVVTIHGFGFVQGDSLQVRFTSAFGDPSNRGGGPLDTSVKATFVSPTKIQCEAPRVSQSLHAHVTVANGDGIFSASPLVHVRGRTGGGGAGDNDNALVLTFSQEVPGCPGCFGNGFQSDSLKVDAKRRVRERWVADTGIGTDFGGAVVTIKAVGYAVVDINEDTQFTKLKDLGDTQRQSLPGFGENAEGSFYFAGGSPVGGAGNSGRGGSRGGGFFGAGTNGPKQTGTFLPGAGLVCVFLCRTEVTDENGVASFGFATATSRRSVSHFSEGDYASRASSNHDARWFDSSLRREEATGVAGNLSTDDALINGLFHGRETFLATSRWIDYATVACMSPPWPGLLNSTQNITTGRNCSIAVSNDHGNTVDTDAYANAARVGFTYTDKKPTLNSDGGFWESGDGADVERFGALLLKTACSSNQANNGLVGKGVTARGPLSGNTLLTIKGTDFVKNHLTTKCAFFFGNDSGIGLARIIRPGTVVDENTMSCLSPPRLGISGRIRPGVGPAGVSGVTETVSALFSSASFPPVLGHDLGAPCFFAAVAVSNDGITFSQQFAAFLYCDVHVSPLGSYVDFNSVTGTPSNPFPNLQSAFAAGLRGAFFESYMGKQSQRDADETSGVYFQNNKHGHERRGATRFGAFGARETGSRSGKTRYAGEHASRFGSWVNGDTVLASGGSYGSESDTALSVANDQVLSLVAAGDAHLFGDSGAGDTFSVRPSKASVTISCGDANYRRPLFVSRQTVVGKAPAVGLDGAAIGSGGAVSFSPGISLDGCFHDGEVVHLGTRCAPGANGCAGDVDTRSTNTLGGATRDPNKWEQFDYHDELEYRTFEDERFYDFV